MITFGIAVLVVIFAGYIYWKNGQQASNGSDNLPPGTLGWPVIGESLEFLCKKVQFFKDRHDQYGQIYKTHLFGKRIIRVAGAENIRKINLGENKIVQSSYPTSVMRLLGMTSIAMSQGEVHRIRKQKLQKYLSPEYLRNHAPIMANTISERLQTWCTMPEVNLHEECRKLFIELASKFLIKIDIENDDVDAMRMALDTFNENVFCLPINLPGFGLNKALKAKKSLIEIITRVMNSPPANNNNTDALPSLLEGLRGSEGDVVNIDTDQEMLNAIVELLFGGSETVSSGGFMLAYNLITHPKVFSRLTEEVTKHGLQNLNEPVSAHDIHGLTYVQAVVKETLRASPPVGGAYRTVLEPFEMEGYTIPKGWSVVFSIRETHHKDNNVENPMTFNPERWTEPGFSLDKYSYAPFGAGPRICPGQAYAKLILNLFAVEFTRTCSAKIVKDSDLDSWPTPHPVEPILVKFEKN